jgi:hypothetical protein
VMFPSAHRQSDGERPRVHTAVSADGQGNYLGLDS